MNNTNNTATRTTTSDSNRQTFERPELEQYPLTGDAYRWLLNKLGATSKTIRDLCPRDLWLTLIREAKSQRQKLIIDEVDYLVAAYERAGTIEDSDKPKGRTNIFPIFGPHLENAVISKSVAATLATIIDSASENQEPVATEQKESATPKRTKKVRPANACYFDSRCEGIVQDKKPSWILLKLGKKLAARGCCFEHRQVVQATGVTFYSKETVEAEIKRRADEEAELRNLIRKEKEEKRALAIVDQLVEFVPVTSEVK